LVFYGCIGKVSKHGLYKIYQNLLGDINK